MTGTSDDYEPDQTDALVDAMEAAFDMFGDGDPSWLHVSADIEWNNTWNRQAHRTTSIPLAGMQRSREATAKAVAARNAWKNGKPAPKSWRAQLRDLGKTKSGRDAINGIGSPGTRARWASGKQTPGKANRERIERASRERWEGIDAAREARYRDAAREAADAFTDEIREATGGDVRFRDIDGFDFS